MVEVAFNRIFFFPFETHCALHPAWLCTITQIWQKTKGLLRFPLLSHTLTVQTPLEKVLYSLPPPKDLQTKCFSLENYPKTPPKIWCTSSPTIPALWGFSSLHFFFGRIFMWDLRPPAISIGDKGNSPTGRRTCARGVGGNLAAGVY